MDEIDPFNQTAFSFHSTLNPLFSRKSETPLHRTISAESIPTSPFHSINLKSNLVFKNKLIAAKTQSSFIDNCLKSKQAKRQNSIDSYMTRSKYNFIFDNVNDAKIKRIGLICNYYKNKNNLNEKKEVVTQKKKVMHFGKLGLFRNRFGSDGKNIRKYKINMKETSENSIEGSGLKFHLPIINFPKGMITTKAVKLAYDKFKIKYC
jgi:hypothetical protein